MRTVPLIVLLAAACTGDDGDTDTKTDTTDQFADTDTDTDADADADTDSDADADTGDTGGTKVANLLINGGFESDDAGTPARPTDYSTFVLTGGQANFETAVTGDAIYNSKNTFTAHGGKKGMKLFGQFTGGESFTAVFQDFVGTLKAGSTYEYTGWYYMDADDPLQGTNDAYLVAKYFVDNVGFAFISLEQSAIVTGSSDTGKWVQLSINGTVPKGAGYVQIGVEYRNCVGETTGCYDGGGIFFDDLVLTQ